MIRDLDDKNVVVELTDVSRMFGDTAAVTSLSLSLVEGEFFSLLGPSGCGKTTTLRMIAGFERPDSGTIRIRDHDMVEVPPHRRPVNTVFQSYALFWHLDLFENVAFGLRERKLNGTEVSRRVREALSLVRLEGLERRRPRDLSGGQQQRVALARAIVNEPDILLLDEPLGALDLKLRRAMQLELKALQRRLNMVFLYVTHDQEEALSMSDRVGVMSHGRLEQIGSPEEIYDFPQTRYVADFVGEANVVEGRIVECHKRHVRLALDGGGVVASDATTDLTVGEGACLIIRPERIDIDRENTASGVAPEGRTQVGGIVEDAVFLGNHRKFLVNVGGKKSMCVISPHRIEGNATPTIGDAVRLSWAWSDSRVVPSRLSEEDALG